MILKACPDIAMYTRDGISSWNELFDTAKIVRSALGISPSAWEAAREAMGNAEAAVTIAGILNELRTSAAPAVICAV